MKVEILSRNANDGIPAFEQLLREQCERLGIVPKLRRGVSVRGGSRRRIVIVFIDRSNRWPRHEATFERLLEAGVAVLPVVADPRSARYMPRSLSHINAFVKRFFARAWSACLVDEVLSMLWLRRRTPKVFISYKRIDSGPIASQLYDRFSRLGYETFLDEASVQRGADFQRELKWWLNDADLLVVLASPRFPLSKWCMEEVSFCQQRHIGIAAIEWPDEIYGKRPGLRFPQVRPSTPKPAIVGRTMPDQEFMLRRADFVGVPAAVAAGANPQLPTRELSDNALDRLIAHCARQRTISIQQRLEELIPLARRVLPASGRVVHAGDFGDLAFRDRRGKQSFVRVLPFRPRPENIHDACAVGVGYYAAGCFYEENDPQDPRARALRWLGNGIRRPSTKLSESRIWATCGGFLL